MYLTRVIFRLQNAGVNRIEVTKEIIKTNPNRRIIIASAHPRETVFGSMKEIGHLVANLESIYAIENKQFYSESPATTPQFSFDVNGSSCANRGRFRI